METAILISTDKSLLDVKKIHFEIKNSYWGGYQSKEQTQKTIENSISYGVYQSGEQVGFARVITDEVVFAHIMDVVIFEGSKGQGLGRRLIEHVLGDPRLNVLTICLKTKDGHTFYGKYGFKTVGNSELWMAIDTTKLD